MFHRFIIRTKCVRLFKTICIFLLFSSQLSQGILASESSSCGVLYEKPNYDGMDFIVGDEQYFSNLQEEYTSSNTVWNLTSSFKVMPGCLFTACNESYFDGQCQEFRDGRPNLPQEFLYVDSVNCTCAAECQCSGIYMRKSSCARAYLDQGGCNRCNAYYTDLKGVKPFFPEDFMKRTKSVLVRKGCTLSAYEEEDFEGDHTSYTGLIENWDPRNEIKSYECSCLDTDAPVTKKPRRATYPEFIEVPQTLDEVSKMLNGETGRHPALVAALQSLRHKRSSRNAYILLLGTTGSGKSSAINLLFDKPDLTKVGHGNSTTHMIHEFRVPVPVDELGISNSELRVIDTPGLGDTKGIEHDAKFLATLDEFLTNHEELHNRIPNIVLIFHRFTDNRIYGQGSQYVKMLRGLDSFRERITDKHYSNVIFVQTHYTSVNKVVQRKPKEKIALFKKTIEDFSFFPKPTSQVMAENLPETQELPLLNGFYRLPNGDYYPRNLFEKIQLHTSSGGDPIGGSIITAAFRDSDDFNITSWNMSLVGNGNAKVSKYMNIINGAIYNIKNTEVAKLLEKAYESMDSKLKTDFPYALHYLQKSLNIRNINNQADIPRTTPEKINLLSSLKQNDATLFLLKEGLSIIPPVLKENTITGYSYNVFKDIPLPVSPLELGSMKLSDIGYTFPSVMSCIIGRKGAEIFNIFATKEEYVEYRLGSLNIGGKIPASNFTGEIRPGSNIEGITMSSDGTSLTAVREFRNFELVLNDQLNLTQDFIKVLNTLTPFNSTDHENVETWKTFFNDYGTHVVQSAYGGGAIEIHLQSDQQLGLGVVELLYDFVQFAEDAAMSRISNKTLGKEGIRHSLKFRGGDHAYHTTDLTKMSLDESAKLLENWKDSLRLSPIILTSETRLLPISELAKKVGQNISTEIQRATELLFSSSLKYEKPKKPSSNLPGSGREETTFTQNENVAMFTEMLAKLMEESRKSDERFQTMMLKMEEDRRLMAERQEKAREEERAWERKQEELRRLERLKDIEFARKAEEDRQKFQRELLLAREKAEKERQKREEEYQKRAAAAAAAAAAQQAALMKALLNRGGSGGGGGGGGFLGGIGRGIKKFFG